MHSKNKKSRSLRTGFHALRAGVMALLLGGFVQQTLGYIGDYAPDAEYCNVFSQELIKDPRYASFLLSYDSPFYESVDPQWKVRNANIEEWQKYLGLDYDQAYCLVMKTTRTDIQALTKGGQTTDPKLAFLTCIASQLAAPEPETVTISSPHTQMYRDYFQISSVPRLTGSMSKFGAPHISFVTTGYPG